MQQQVADSTPALSVDTAGGQFLTFMLAGEEYGVEILKVQEIKGWDRVTPIPNTPDHVLGVLNLRGAVVSVIDLRKRFALPSVEYDAATVVIVVRVSQEGKDRTLGMVVDAVADVYHLDSRDVQAPPEMGNAVHTDFVRGLATFKEKMVILLDVDSLVDFEDLDDEPAPGDSETTDAEIH